jgi:HAD superfamily hydrolase (TIGR01509 family)
MDGTLTEPMLDFPQIKTDMGIGDGPILESLALLGDTRRQEAEAVLLRHEEIAAENSSLNPGCRELLDLLATQKIPVALITRNSRLSVDTVIRRHGLEIAIRITREDGPFKPSPFPLKLACQRLGIEPQTAWMVGDGQYDVEAAAAAAIPSIWISHGKPRHFAAEPWMTVGNLHELAEILTQIRSR